MKTDARKKVISSITLSLLMITIILFLSFYLDDTGLETNSKLRSLPPSVDNIFGTDWMGRDMLTRTVKGLKFSMAVGLLGSSIGVLIAIVLGIISAISSDKVDQIILWFVDMFISMPHLVFMILVSFVVGKGARGVVIATAITHWPSLTRVIRNEVNSIKNLEYIKLSKNMGKSNQYIIKNHILPAIAPQILIGFILLFPHVILHEASMTFLGFGLSAQQPSIGIILSEAAKHISMGNWWLVVLPGSALIVLVKSIDNIGEAFRKLHDPQERYI